jgi:hypothetical protein
MRRSSFLCAGHPLIDQRERERDGWHHPIVQLEVVACARPEEDMQCGHPTTSPYLSRACVRSGCTVRKDATDSSKLESFLRTGEGIGVPDECGGKAIIGQHIALSVAP